MSDPRLRKEGKRILSVLSCLPSGLAYEDVYEIFPSDALRGAEQLEVTGLASQSQERDRLYLLEPIRAYVKRRDPPTETDFRSLSNYFLKLADGGNYVHKENGSIWRRKLASEFDNIQIMIDKELESRSADLETRAMLATVALGRYQRFAGRGSTELLDKAINLHGNTKIINSAVAEPQRRRGSIMNAKAIKRSIAVAECLRRRGSIMQMRSEPGGALKDFESAQAIYEGLPQTVQATLGIAECVSNRAESKRLLSDDSMAIDLFKMALDVYAQAKMIANTSDEKIMRGEAFCHQRLGVLAQGNLEYDEAREWYNHALTLFSAIGDLIGKALCKKGIGDLKTLSEKNVALQSYEEALRLFEDAQFERGAADCRYSLGDLAFSRRDCEQALVLYKHARSGYEKADSEHGKANCVYSISDVRLFQLYGNTDRSETTVPAMLQEVLADYEKAEAIFRKNKDNIASANCVQGISDVLVLQGDTEGATRLRIEAARFVDLEFKNKPPATLFWVKPSGYFSRRWRK